MSCLENCRDQFPQEACIYLCDFLEVILALGLLDKVQSKAICLINNPNLTKSLQPLACCCLVGDLSIFYRYFHRHCSQEIRKIIPVPLTRVRATRTSTHNTLSKVHCLLHKLYLTNRHSSQEHAICGASCLLAFLNVTTCYLSIQDQ